MMSKFIFLKIVHLKAVPSSFMFSPSPKFVQISPTTTSKMFRNADKQKKALGRDIHENFRYKQSGFLSWKNSFFSIDTSRKKLPVQDTR